jgi:hypothetical protein
MVQNPEALTTFSRLNYISCKYHINRVISPAGWSGALDFPESSEIQILKKVN